MADMPFFKFYHQDWLAGTGGLSAIEKGVYITLLALMYDAGGKIRRDDSRLAMRCGARLNHFRAALQALIDDHKIVQDGDFLTNTRVEKEQVVYHDLCKKNSGNAAQRWAKVEQKQQPQNATASISQCQNDAIQKSEVRSQNIDNKKTNKKDQVASFLAERADFLSDLWAVMPKRRGDAPKPFKEAVAKKVLAGVPAEKIEAGIRAYAEAERGSSGEYRAMSVTWINQERWEADWSASHGPPKDPRFALMSQASRI